MAYWLGLGTRDAAPRRAMVLPPSRTAWEPMSVRRSVAVPSVWRALQVLVTGASQLTMDVYRGGYVVDGATPSIVRTPNSQQTLSEWLSDIVLSLAIDGNAFIRVDRVDGMVVDLHVLPPNEVGVGRDGTTNEIRYQHKGTTYTRHHIRHLSILKPPGWLRGMGPIEAARRGLAFADGAAEYASGWFTETGQPTGVLSSEAALTRQQALEYRDMWNGIDENGEPIDKTQNPSGIKVLGRGLTYEPILLKPADVLWLEAQDFTTTEIARLFGIPTSLMAIGLDGKSTTYANVTQEWLGFIRWTLMAYLRPIEELLSALTPRGQLVRFNLDAVLRADTLSRYQAHAVGINAGFLDPEEVRRIEGLQPRTQDQEVSDVEAQ